MSEVVTVGANVLTVRDAAIFGPAQPAHARRFAGRVLMLPEVRSLTLEPGTGEARLAYQVATGQRRAFLNRLADAVAGGEGTLDEAAMPPWPAGETVTLTRVGELITTLRVIAAKPGVLRVAHHRLAVPEGAMARRVRGALRAVPGVLEVAAQGGNGTLAVHFDPARSDVARIIRAIEVQLADAGLPVPFGDVPPVALGISHTTLGLGTVGELMLPLATPVAAGILVAINLSTAWEALRHLSHGKAGVPLARISLLVCTLATGQVVAAALTDWSLRYWQRRSRQRLADETRRLLEDTLVLPEQAQVAAADGRWRSIPVVAICAGDRIRVAAGEGIAVDGEVIEGEALVDESALCGRRAPVRKSAGDAVVAGSRLLVGELGIKVERTGSNTAAARIAETFATVASGFTRDPVLRRRSVRITERAVLPTLVTAGVGFAAAGGLATMGPILRQDWISGPVLAVPLVTLHTLRAALQSGVLVRSGAAIQRLAKCGFIVFDGDDPLLAEADLELAGMQSRLADTDTVLRQVAGAGLFLGDERSLALANACRERGLIVRQPSLLALEAGRIEVRLGQHVIRLSDGAAGPTEHFPELLAEIDGHEVARLGFRPGTRPRAAAAVQRLSAAGLQTFLISAGTETETRALARRLGVGLSGGELDAAGKIRFLQGLRRRGVEPLYVGRLGGRMELAEAAHVAVATDGMNGHPAEGDMLLLGRSHDSLADLIELARRYEPQILTASRMALIPNLLCVAGGFGGVLNGIAANVIANVGVMNVDRRLRRLLEATPRPSEAGRRLVVE